MRTLVKQSFKHILVAVAVLYISSSVSLAQDTPHPLLSDSLFEAILERILSDTTSVYIPVHSLTDSQLQALFDDASFRKQIDKRMQETSLHTDYLFNSLSQQARKIGLYSTFILTVLTVLVTFLLLNFSYKNVRKATEEVRQAEQEAFKDYPKELDEKLRSLAESQEGLEDRAAKIASILEDSQSSIEMGRLFNLYGKQIEKYQQETRLRATWSFIFAIFAMFTGFVFVIWGGTILLTARESIALIAGGLVSGIGGAISAYITKTFLNVHRLSLSQLNHYFRQPVINDHIIMAQRLAEECDDAQIKNKSYEKIIDSITKLIVSQGSTKSNDSISPSET